METNSSPFDSESLLKTPFNYDASLRLLPDGVEECIRNAKLKHNNKCRMVMCSVGETGSQTETSEVED
ncbi:uncharacterized [Tachysurus ichikawai]